jgi:hypothetical protein
VQLTLSHDRLRIMLGRNGTTVGLAGKYVDTYAFADGYAPASLLQAAFLLAGPGFGWPLPEAVAHSLP